MPIGSDLNLTLPAVGDNPTTAASRIIDTFERLEAAVEGDVPSGAMDVTSDIDMQTHGLTNTAFAGLANQATSTAALPGYAFRFGDDMWWAHPDGNFQVTDGVGLNAAGIGGIGGGYGAGAEDVLYDAGTDEYTFLDGPGDYSDLSVNGVRLEDPAGGSVRLVAHQASVSGDQDWSLRALGATTSGIVTQTAAGITGVQTSVADAFTFSGGLTVAGALTRTSREMTIIPNSTSSAAGNWTQASAESGAAAGVVAPPAGDYGYTVCFPLHKGDIVRSVIFRTIGGGAGEQWKISTGYGTSTGTTVNLSGPTTVSITAAAATHTADITDHTMATGEGFFARAEVFAGVPTGTWYAVTLTYDQA